jgi:hypothetical protein
MSVDEMFRFVGEWNNLLKWTPEHTNLLKWTQCLQHRCQDSTERCDQLATPLKNNEYNKGKKGTQPCRFLITSILMKKEQETSLHHG